MMNIQKTLESMIKQIETEGRDPGWNLANEYTGSLLAALRLALKARVDSGRREPESPCEECARYNRATHPPCEHEALGDLVYATAVVITCRTDGSLGPDGDQGFKTLQEAMEQASAVAVKLAAL